MKQQRQDDYTVMGLRDNLDKMTAFLQEHNLVGLISLFKSVKLVPSLAVAQGLAIGQVKQPLIPLAVQQGT